MNKKKIKKGKRIMEVSISIIIIIQIIICVICVIYMILREKFKEIKMYNKYWKNLYESTDQELLYYKTMKEIDNQIESNNIGKNSVILLAKDRYHNMLIYGGSTIYRGRKLINIDEYENIYKNLRNVE